MPNFLKNTSCYLIGAIEHDQLFGRDWRTAVSSSLNKMGIKIYNPLNRPDWMDKITPYVPPDLSRDEILHAIYNSNSKMHSEAQTIIRRICIRYVGTCDFVFCYLPNAKTFGTTEELVIASNLGKPIIMVCPDDIPSLWIYDLIKSEPIFDNIIDAVEYLEEINRGDVEIEALKWIFIGDSYERKNMRCNYI